MIEDEELFVKCFFFMIKLINFDLIVHSCKLTFSF